MKKRHFTALLIVMAMVVTLFAGCGKKEDNQGATDNGADTLAGNYDITVWVPEAAVELTRQQINDFNSSNEFGIKFNPVIEAVSESESATQMITDVEAGPDIFFFAQDQAARLIQAGALSKLGASAQKSISEANAAGVVAAATSGSEMYAYPLTADNGYFMYYDKTVIDPSHIDSMEDILKDCEKAGKTFCFEMQTGAWYTASFFFGTGCVSEWTTGDDGSFISINDTFNSDAGLIAAKGMYKLVTSSAHNSSSDGSQFAAAIPAAVVVSGTWDYNTVEGILGANMGVADLPSFTVDGKSYHLGSFNGCKLLGVKPQKDAARAAAINKLAQYLVSEKAQLERFTTLAWGPANLAAQNNEAVKANPGLSALFEQSAYSRPQGQIHGSWWDIAKVIATDVKDSDGSDAGLRAALQKYADTISALFNMTADEKDRFSVIGSVCGTNWDTDIEMTRSAELGTQKWYSNAILLNAGEEFKVRQGASWTVNFGSDGKLDGPNVVVPETGYYFVKLDFDKDANTGVITLEKNSPVNGWTVIGTVAGSSWDKDFEMAITADGQAFVSVDEFTLAAGTEFKVRQGRNWDVSYGNGGANYVVEKDVTAKVSFNPATGEITLITK